MGRGSPWFELSDDILSCGKFWEQQSFYCSQFFSCIQDMLDGKTFQVTSVGGSQILQEEIRNQLMRSAKRQVEPVFSTRPWHVSYLSPHEVKPDVHND
mmetsp:Transcript_1511/g.1803  ORF Transcript_1511/g.1803 Transcript_1511/m.1803 type:complete len:98 (-) Transcript_1511:39-332(-)